MAIEDDIDALAARVQSAHMTIAIALTDLTELVSRAESAASRAELAAVNSSLAASTSDTAASVAAAAASVSSEAAMLSVESVETIEDTIEESQEDATQEEPESTEVHVHHDGNGEEKSDTEPELPSAAEPITIIVKQSGTDTHNSKPAHFRRGH
jgi:hypothetical protein